MWRRGMVGVGKSMSNKNKTSSRLFTAITSSNKENSLASIACSIMSEAVEEYYSINGFYKHHFPHHLSKRNRSRESSRVSVAAAPVSTEEDKDDVAAIAVGELDNSVQEKNGPYSFLTSDGSVAVHAGRSHSRSVSRSPSPRGPSDSCSRHCSRSYSPAPRRHADHSLSPDDRRHADDSVRSRRDAPKERDRKSYSSDGRYVHEPLRSPRDAPKVQGSRSYSPGYETGDQNGNGRNEKSAYDADEDRLCRKRSPRPASRSPSGSRSRSLSGVW